MVDYTKIEFAKSSCGQSLFAWVFGDGDEYVHINAGIHGNEPEGVRAAANLLETLCGGSKSLCHKSVVIVPSLNPDGGNLGLRQNSRGVDLNRNFPTRNWEPCSQDQEFSHGAFPCSEEEIKGYTSLLECYPSSGIISLHSNAEPEECGGKETLEFLNYDGPGLDLATAMSRKNGFPILESVSNPTPGSMGTYYGVERIYPL